MIFQSLGSEIVCLHILEFVKVFLVQNRNDSRIFLVDLIFISCEYF